MNFPTIGKLAGALALTVALTGCIDVTMDIQVESETTGTATMTSVMSKDFYAMVKAAGEAGESSGEGFCEEEGAVLNELADGSAECVQVESGLLSELGEDDDGPKVTVVSPGVVRISFATDEVTSQVTEDAQDEETKAMMQSFFEGHFITMRIGGKKVVDTNMDLTPDGRNAEVKIPFTDLLSGTATFPDEYYAVVDTN